MTSGDGLERHLPSNAGTTIECVTLLVKTLPTRILSGVTGRRQCVLQQNVAWLGQAAMCLRPVLALFPHFIAAQVAKKNSASQRELQSSIYTDDMTNEGRYPKIPARDSATYETAPAGSQEWRRCFVASKPAGPGVEIHFSPFALDCRIVYLLRNVM